MTDDEQPPATTASRRRSRGSEATARSEALERLKASRSGGRRRTDASTSQIKMEKPIYDTMEEEEYDAFVARRKEELRGFIEDDNGLGYLDEGEEEDWTKGGVSLTSDESEGEAEEKKKRKKAEKKDGQQQQRRKQSAVSLTDAASMAGAQKISAMFTSSVFKKSKDDKVNASGVDSVLEDVLAEIEPTEEDRQRRRRKHNGAPSQGKPATPSSTGGSIVVRKPDPIEFVINNDYDMKLAIESGPIEENGTAVFCQVAKDLSPETGKTPIDQSHDSSTNGSEVVERSVESYSEIKAEQYSLNAKIKEEKDPALSATAGWHAARSAGGVDSSNDLGKANLPSESEGKSELKLDSDGSLPFYILDAYEEYYGVNMGNLYLFGKVIIKVNEENTYHSCCVVVKNMQRCVYAIPNGSVFDNDVVKKLEKEAEMSKISSIDFRAKLHEVASALKNEVAEHLMNLNVATFSMVPVKRKTCTFDRSDIPLGENYVLKINYPFKDPPLPADIKGDTFCALLGTHCSALELFLVKRKIIGPSWLSISKFSVCPAPKRVSWCKFEVAVECPKDIRILTSFEYASVIPPVVVTAINLKTVINEKFSVNEIASASVICCHKVKIDTPMLSSEWKKPGLLSHFTVVRKLDGGIFPLGFNKEATDRNTKSGSIVLCSESSERALLNRLMIELHKLDSDVLVGHNISGFDLDVLLHRAQACKVPSTMWSRIGRLKRSSMPKLSKGNTTFGTGASPGIMSCIAGRLLCDTFLCARDLLKEVSYSLTQLTKTQLTKDRKEIAPHEIPKMFQTAESLVELIECGETDAWLSMELMFHLSVLPLTRQLTNNSGNLWGRTLQGARAQRVEYLLLHAFHKKKYIVPDKFTSSHVKEIKVTKRRLSGDEDKNPEDFHVDDEIEAPNNHQAKGKKGPAYLGGLVLEPKRGLYDKYILLLDFNSLYPSIIQEYNICFTTVERSNDGSPPSLPSTEKPSVLPELLKDLVVRRQAVKKAMKTASGLKYQQLDIQQQALKLTANSMYGCLGFSNSRFYAKPLAELITLQGREILQSTVDLVQNSLNLEVIYGDTDSIMIYSGLDDIARARAIADKVIREVNNKYKRLEIDLDGLYKRMLLLKKKKYAAVKVLFKDGVSYEVVERKGLDMVRRDWSLLSKELGDFCLTQILSGGSCEDVVESIHGSLMKVQEEMRNGEIALEKYVITKSLTRPPEAYPDGRNQPHVQVALRLKQNGHTSGCSAGDTVPYVICQEQGASSSSVSGIAQRARHPEELKKEDGQWMIDIDYYLSQQIHPVVSRLCASIQGTSPERLAECLGLDSSKYRSKSSEAVNNDPSTSLLCTTDDKERYRGCEPLIMSCPSCSDTFDCPTVFSYICKPKSGNPAMIQVEDSTSNFWFKFHCPKCPKEAEGGKISSAMLANQVKRQAEGFVATYYKNWMICEDESCQYATRRLNLRVVGDCEKGTVCPNYPQCNGRLVRKYTERDLYKQLSYFCHVLDTVRCVEKMDVRTRMQAEKDLVTIRPFVDSGSTIVQKLRDRCAYGWVQLSGLIVTA